MKKEMIAYLQKRAAHILCYQRLVFLNVRTTVVRILRTSFTIGFWAWNFELSHHYFHRAIFWQWNGFATFPMTWTCVLRREISKEPCLSSRKVEWFVDLSLEKQKSSIFTGCIFVVCCISSEWLFKRFPKFPCSQWSQVNMIVLLRTLFKTRKSQSSTKK